MEAGQLVGLGEAGDGVVEEEEVHLVIPEVGGGRRVARELGVPSAELALRYLSSSPSDPAADEPPPPSDAAVDRRAGSMLDPPPPPLLLLLGIGGVVSWFLVGEE